MLIGHTDVFPQHAAVFAGKDTEPSTVVTDEFTSGKPAAWDDGHVLVKSRGSFDLTSVHLWSGAMPATGETIFDGTLYLPDGKLRIFDLMTMNVLTRKLDGLRPRLLIRVDEPGRAARVDIGIDLGEELFVPRTAPGFPLPPLLSSTEYLERPANEFAELLADRDMPVSRLAAAILLMVEKVEPERIDYRVSALEEWLRGLSRSLPHREASTLAADVGERVREFRRTPGDPEDFAVSLATTTLASLR